MTLMVNIISRHEAGAPDCSLNFCQIIVSEVHSIHLHVSVYKVQNMLLFENYSFRSAANCHSRVSDLVADLFDPRGQLLLKWINFKANMDM